MTRRLLPVFILAVQVAKVICQEPQIVEEILPEVKRKGHTGYLNCTVTRQGDNKVFWMQDDYHISSDVQILAYNEIENGKYKYEVVRQYRDNDKTTYMLVINRLREEDDGRYLCKIYLQGYPVDKWPMKFGSLTVQVPPTILVSATSNTVQKRQGTSVVFRCNATGSPNPNITWIRADGKPLYDGRLTHRGNFFEIPKIRKDDRGTYRCVADNTVAPPAHHDAKLVVYYTPEASPIQDTVGQAQNRRFTAILECLISGMPEPNLRWYRETNNGDMLIVDNEKYQISQLLNHGTSLQVDQIWYTLKILNVQANDYTNYFCEGNNNMGTTRSTIRLYETNECQGPDCPSIGVSSTASFVISRDFGVALGLTFLACVS